MQDNGKARVFYRRTAWLAAAVVVALGAMTTAAVAAPVAEPSSWSFEDRLGPGSATKTFTLRPDETPLIVHDVTVAGEGFTIESDGCKGRALSASGDPEAAAASCTVSVAFAAAQLDAVGGRLDFTTTSGPVTVHLEGVGTGPRAVADPAEGRAFSAAVGTTSPAQRVTLRNTGNEPLAGIDAALIGPNYTIVADSCTGATLTTAGAGAGCAVDITFTPSAATTYAATLRFGSNDPARPTVDVALIGTGTPAALAAGPLAPDSDGDGVRDPVDNCRTVAGDLANGCPADRDRDGVVDAVDVCKGTAGDLKNGCPSELNADVVGRWRVNSLLSQLLSLNVRAPRGSRIELRCSGRRGVCDFRRRVIAKTTRRTTGLTRYFKGRRILRAYTTITVRVTRAQQIGRYERLETRTKRRLPKVTQRCIGAGTGKIQPCP